MVLRLVGAATLSVIGVGVSLAAGGVAALALPDAVPFTGLWVGAMVAVGTLIATLRPAPEMRLAIVLSWLSLAPVLWVGTAWTVGRPLVVSHWVCGTGTATLLLLAPFVVAGLLTVTTVVLGGMTRRVRARHARAAVMAAALIATGLAAGLSARSLLGVHEGVEPDAWVRSLPVVAHVRASELGGALGPFDVALEEEGGRRYAAFVPRGAPADTAERHLAAPGSVVVLRRSSEAGIWVLELDEHTRRALRDGDTQFTDVRVDDVREQLVAPRAWQLIAAAGSALALLLLVVAWRAGRRPRWLDRARPATVSDDSVTLRFEDGALPARGVASTMLPPGPALVLAPPGLPGYRSDGTTGPLDARRGTADEVMHRARMRGAALAAVALVCATLAACPLLAALHVLS